MQQSIFIRESNQDQLEQKFNANIKELLVITCANEEKQRLITRNLEKLQLSYENTSGHYQSIVNVLSNFDPKQIQKELKLKLYVGDFKGSINTVN